MKGLNIPGIAQIKALGKHLSDLQESNLPDDLNLQTASFVRLALAKWEINTGRLTDKERFHRLLTIFAILEWEIATEPSIGLPIDAATGIYQFNIGDFPPGNERDLLEELIIKTYLHYAFPENLRKTHEVLLDSIATNLANLDRVIDIVGGNIDGVWEIMESLGMQSPFHPHTYGLSVAEVLAGNVFINPVATFWNSVSTALAVNGSDVPYSLTQAAHARLSEPSKISLIGRALLILIERIKRTGASNDVVQALRSINNETQLWKILLLLTKEVQLRIENPFACLIGLPKAILEFLQEKPINTLCMEIPDEMQGFVYLSHLQGMIANYVLQLEA